jgi:AcrR family transcriptional regulator
MNNKTVRTTKAKAVRRGPRRRGEILKGLERIFLAEGYRDLTMDGLAARLNCSKRTLYDLAPTKHELFLVVLNEFLGRIRERGYEALKKSEDIEGRLTGFMAPGYLESSGASARFMEDIYGFKPALLILEAHQRERLSVVRQIVQEGVAQKRFRQLHAHLVAEAYLAAFARVNQPEILAEVGLSYSEATAELYQLIAYGLFSRDKAGSRRRSD